jgi:hypothetical protein
MDSQSCSVSQSIGKNGNWPDQLTSLPVFKVWGYVGAAGKLFLLAKDSIDSPLIPYSFIMLSLMMRDTSLLNH